MSEQKSHTNSFLTSLPKNIFSGFVVSLIALPLALGLALASEAPPISGVIASIVGGLVVALIGGSHVTITGPGNGLVIVLLAAITTLGGGDLYQGYLYTLAAVVFSGVLILLLGFLKMGRLADFFPASAIQGMLAAIGIGILSKQFHIMIGNNREDGDIIELLSEIPESLVELTQIAGPSQQMAALIGAGSLLIMIYYSKIRNKYFQLIPAPMWILILSVSISYIYSALGSSFPLEDRFLVSIPDDILGNLAFPDFGVIWKRDFLMAVFALTLIASIESLLSIKAIDKLDPQSRRSNTNKDLKALGLATSLSGLLGGLNVVTVIARSSVNVNNGATNRTANFMHAVFLLAFVLLFQEQLRRIPLAALAAILVYTGYKLATPRLLKNIAKVGREQVVIFLATLITTLFTNLITGISAGIVVTFIIHVILSSSFGLFFNHLVKPNILMFKEKDGDNYYISIKHFSSFINFYKLKNKIDAVPENEDLVVDFSMCSFVDHTVMEGLENYSETFKKKGGSLELVGLDKHETDSFHPFAIRKFLPLAALKPIERYLTKRQTDLETTAKEYHWEYMAEKNTDTSFLRDFVFFKSKEVNYFYNQLYGGDKHSMVFDLEFTEGAFIAREVVKTTVMFIKVEERIPVFSLDKEGLLSVLYNLAGFRDIIIDNHPDFNRRFYLSGENEDSIRDLFTDELVLFLESNPYYHVESNGNSLLILKKERLLSVQEIKQLIYFGQQLDKLLQPVENMQ